MKLARVGIIAAAILAVSSVAFAQKPDFSGVWTMDAPAAPPAGAGAGAGGGGQRGGGGMGGAMTVKQDATTLTIERTMGETKTTQVYKLDGTESVNKMSMGRGENAREVESKSTAKWDGNKLTITTKQARPDGTEGVSSQTWSLDGGVLSIESTRTRPDGTPVTAKATYKKTT